MQPSPSPVRRTELLGAVPARSRATTSHDGPSAEVVARTLGFRSIEVCVDYWALVHDFPADPHAATTEDRRNALLALGDPQPERLGVVYVYAHWGFLVIPPAGFPELRVNFFRSAPDAERRLILERIGHLLQDRQK